MQLIDSEQKKRLVEIRLPISFMGIMDDPVIPSLKVVLAYLELSQQPTIKQDIIELAQFQSQGHDPNIAFHYSMGPTPPLHEGPGMGVWVRYNTPRKGEFYFFLPWKNNEDIYDLMIKRGCILMSVGRGSVAMPLYIRSYELFAFVKEWSSAKKQ